MDLRNLHALFCEKVNSNLDGAQEPENTLKTLVRGFLTYKRIMKKQKHMAELRKVKKMHSVRKSSDVEKELRNLANSWIRMQEACGYLRERPGWDEAFMLAAYEAANRSSCRYIWTGSVLVKDKRIIASGYNGAPTGIRNCLERGCRKDEIGIEFQNRRTGNCRGTHAERNAMDQIARPNLKGASLYTVVFPCSDCAKTIVGNEIREVYYSIMYGESDSLTKELFQEAGVSLKELIPNLEKHYLRLKEIDNQRYNKGLVQLI